MNVKRLLDSLYIDSNYTMENLTEYKRAGCKNENQTFTDLIRLFSFFENKGLKSNSFMKQLLDNLRFYPGNYTISYSYKGPVIKGIAHSSLPTELNAKDKSLETDMYEKEEKDVYYQIEYIKVIIKQKLDLIGQKKMTRKDRNNLINDIFKQINDSRLSRAIYIIISLFNFEMKEDVIRSTFKREFKRCIKEIIEEKKYDSDSGLILVFYGQLLFYILSLRIQDEDFEFSRHYAILEKEVVSYFAYFISDELINIENENKIENIYFAKKGICINSSYDRYEAYNNLGIAAIKMGDWQLANDAYISWLNKKNIGELEIITPSNYSWGVDESIWREEQQGKIACAVMHGNLAYVCGCISDTYEYNSKQGMNFYELSLEHVKKAIELNPENSSYYCTYGTLLSDEMNYSMGNENQLKEHVKTLEKALDQAEKYKSHANSIDDELDASRAYCLNLLKLIFFSVFQDQDDFWKNKLVKRYYRKLKEKIEYYYNINVDDNIDSMSKDLQEEIKKRNRFKMKYAFLESKRSSGLVDRINILLISIISNTEMLKEYLHRREYISTSYYTRVGEKNQNRDDNRKVAYYTTLKNIAHVFEELVKTEQDKAPRPKEDKDKDVNVSKNCLTVMNSKYMNDPNEGIVILEELTKQLDDNRLFSNKNVDEIIKKIFDEKFVFLKSFTEQIDKLTMWNRYANDYNDDGKNSNGCCVLFDPACFVNNICFTKKGTSYNDEKISDDYNLYRVVYISTNGKILRTNNSGLHKNVYKLYENLNTLFQKLNDCLIELEAEYPKDIALYSKIVEESLIKALLNIVFLFKYDDYCDEQESRLILFRESSNQEDIRLISGDVPMLALNPFFQIMINGIIFGPNVRNTEKWKPYFQYQLNNMWNKHEVKGIQNNGEERYFIKKSEINYLT